MSTNVMALLMSFTALVIAVTALYYSIQSHKKTDHAIELASKASQELIETLEHTPTIEQLEGAVKLQPHPG